MGKILRTLALVLVGLAAAALATENNQALSLRFLVWESRELPVWVFLLIALAVGVIVGGASLLIDYLRLQRAVRRERRRADEETRRADEQARRADELTREVETLRSRLADLAGGMRTEVTEDTEPFPDAPGGRTAVARPARTPGDPFE